MEVLIGGKAGAFRDPGGLFHPSDPVSMEWSITELQAFIKEFISVTEYDTSSAVRYVARELGIRIVDRMPIKTGRAAAGWSAAGKALNFSVPSSASARGGDSGYSENLRGTNPRITFENNVPYVIYLEYGWSAQAPLGMVRISVAELLSSGLLPAVLMRDYEDRWHGMKPATGRYEAQAGILTRGLPAVNAVIPSRRSIAARVSRQLQSRRKSHVSTRTLTRIQNSFKGTAIRSRDFGRKR